MIMPIYTEGGVDSEGIAGPSQGSFKDGSVSLAEGVRRKSIMLF